MAFHQYPFLFYLNFIFIATNLFWYRIITHSVSSRQIERSTFYAQFSPFLFYMNFHGPYYFFHKSHVPDLNAKLKRPLTLWKIGKWKEFRKLVHLRFLYNCCTLQTWLGCSAILMNFMYSIGQNWQIRLFTVYCISSSDDAFMIQGTQFCSFVLCSERYWKQIKRSTQQIV